MVGQRCFSKFTLTAAAIVPIMQSHNEANESTKPLGNISENDRFSRENEHMKLKRCEGSSIPRSLIEFSNFTIYVEFM